MKLILILTTCLLCSLKLAAQASFRADDTTRPPGEPVTFRWDASVTVAPVLNPGGLTSAEGEIRLVPPEGRTTYTLSYTQLQGRIPRVESVVVETGSAPVVGPLSALPPIVASGQTARFSFSASGTDSVSVWTRQVGQKDWIPSTVVPVGNSFVLPLMTDSSVRVEAANRFGLSRSSTDVGVFFPAGTQPPRSLPAAPISPGIPSEMSGHSFRNQLVPSEIMASPATRTDVEKSAGFSRQDFGWMELRNQGFKTVSLANFQLRGGVSASLDLLAGGAALAPGQSVILANNRAAFVFRHGTPSVPLFELAKPIASPADSFQIVWSRNFASDAKLVHSVSFDTSLQSLDIASGGGHSIIPKSFASFAPANWTTGARFGGTPGENEPTGSSELLTFAEIYAAGTTGRALEVFNPSPVVVNGDGLWQTEGRWKNASPLTLGGYAAQGLTTVIWKDLPQGPGAHDPSLFLDPIEGGNIGLARTFPGGFPRYLVAYANYGPMAPGQVRVRTVTSTGSVFYRLTSAAGRTPGVIDPPPPPPDVVFTRIHYAPLEPSAEFVEIANRSALPRPLSENGAPLRIRGYDFTFPTGVTLSPGETVTVCALPEAAFRNRVALPANRRIFSGSGKLDNSGERLALEVSGKVVVWGESVTYQNLAPWPTQPVSLGWSLVRLNPETSPDDPANWGSSPVGSP